MKRLLSSCLAIAAIAFITPRPALAATLLINDALLSENITFSVNGFDNSFYLDGVLVQQGLNNPQMVTVPEADIAGVPIVHTFRGDWNSIHFTFQESGVIAFAEGGIPAAQGVSDILTFTIRPGLGGGDLIGTFESDVGLGLLALPAGATVVSGESFDFSHPANLTASATSDIDINVPEPATLALVGLGLAGLGFSRRGKLR